MLRDIESLQMLLRTSRHDERMEISKLEGKEREPYEIKMKRSSGSHSIVTTG